MKFNILQFIFITVLFIGCSSNDEPIQNVMTDETVSLSAKIEKAKTSLDYNDALVVAQLFNDDQSITNHNAKRSVNFMTKAEQKYQVIMGSKEPIAYVVNFNPSGFCVVSATKKTHPVLAYSLEGSFDLTEIEKSPVGIWIDEMNYMSATADQLPDSLKATIKDAWRRYEDTSVDSPTTKYTNPEQLAAYSERRNYYGRQGIMVTTLDNARSSLPYSLYSKIKTIASNARSPEEFTILIINTAKPVTGPLVKTAWHQEKPYNLSIENWYKVGCSPVAVGQIMTSIKHPDSYDWEKLVTSNTQIENLLASLGESFKTNYGKDKSSTYPEDVVSGLIRDYDYDAELTSHDLTRIKKYIIDYRYPVYCRGEDKKGGHAWVCDGYNEGEIHYSVKIDLLSGTTYHLYSSTLTAKKDYQDYIHYNWGFEIGHYNGWYISDSATPIDFDHPDIDYDAFDTRRMEIFMSPKQ